MQWADNNAKPSIDKFLRGATEVAPNASHYFDYAVGHWAAGTYAGETMAETEYGEQRRMLLREPSGEGFILFGDEEKALVELSEDAEAIVSVGLTGMGERLFESALAQGLELGDTLVYQVQNKGKDEVGKGGRVTRQGAWIVSLHRTPQGGKRRARREEAPEREEDEVPFTVPGENRGKRRGARRRGK